jgi:hypothetical protein
MKDWKAKLERHNFFKVQSGKITVCTGDAEPSFIDAELLPSYLS